MSELMCNREAMASFWLTYLGQDNPLILGIIGHKRAYEAFNFKILKFDNADAPSKVFNRNLLGPIGMMFEDYTQ